jgi:hypothetical protein
MATSDEMTSLIDALSKLNSTIEVSNAIATKSGDEAAKLAEEMNTATAKTKDASEANAKLTKATNEQKVASDKTSESLKKFGSELLNISRAGIDLAKSLGTTATQGVQLELNNRMSILSQMLSLNSDSAVTMKEQQMAQQALTSTFVSTAAGMQVSAQGTTAFASALKGGFKSDFELTAQSMRALTVAGVGTSTQMEEFRKASGRSSLSSAQFSKIVTDNSLSFMVYGKSFAKAAADAERLGISLSQVQQAQQNMVTNLDNTIDTVAQLNQLGGNVDFGTLVQKLEMEGPDAVLKYLSSAIPGDLMQSTSFRALVGQLGIPAETILKQQKVGTTADIIEQQMVEAAKATGAVAKGLTIMDRVVTIAKDSYLGMVGSTISVIASFIKLAATTTTLAAAQSAAAGKGLSTGTPAPTGGMAGAKGAALSKAGIGGGALAGGFVGATTFAETGDLKRSIITGIAAMAASVLATGILAAIPGGALFAPFLGPMIGSFAAKTITDFFYKADDMFSPGYGQRVLMGPEGNFALNNNDSVLAGTNLFGGATQSTTKQTSVDMSSIMRMGLSAAMAPLMVANKLTSPVAGQTNTGLEKKLDDLIQTIREASTTINVEGTMKKVPRMQLVGVYSRNEVI